MGLKSTDCIGFFAQNPEDLDLLMQITAGQDPKDMTTLPDFYGKDDEKFNDPIKKIGVIKDFNNEAVAPSIRKALQNKIEELKAKGHEIVELEMPALKYALAAYYIIVPY